MRRPAAGPRRRPGRGEGRHALWLAARGWRVTAVDFSAVGLDRGRSTPYGHDVEWAVADVAGWRAAEASLDLVLVAYLHLPEAETAALLTRAVGWLRPGGHLLVLGHDVDNVAHGVGGPQDPAILHSVHRLAPVAALLDVDRCEQVRRETPAAPRWTRSCGGRDPSRGEVHQVGVLSWPGADPGADPTPRRGLLPRLQHRVHDRPSALSSRSRTGPRTSPPPP
ncbi:class I SAM-dependent methyltransferase [Klenkia terrae]|uniref:class I SAM-dependent methyltransferase n=1 Tax=Klenkia terrae TaxID=1052259 RepID=UPI003607D752